MNNENYFIWGQDGKSPSFDICACCGVTFGYEDNNLKAIRLFRNNWLSNGLKWNQLKLKPEKWNPLRQLRNIQKEYI